MTPKLCSRFAFIGLLLCLATAIQAQILPCNSWTGAASNQWGNASNWSFGHVPNSSEDARIANGANVDAAGSITCNSLYLNDGTLRVSGDVNLFSADIATGSTFTLASIATRKVKGSIGAHGTIIWKGVRLETAPTALSLWGQLTNASDGVFASRTSNDSSIAIYLLTNNGTLRQTGSAKLTLGALQNNGLLEVTAGSLVVADLDGNNGAVLAADGTKVEFHT